MNGNGASARERRLDSIESKVFRVIAVYSILETRSSPTSLPPFYSFRVTIYPLPVRITDSIESRVGRGRGGEGGKGGRVCHRGKRRCVANRNEEKRGERERKNLVGIGRGDFARCFSCSRKLINFDNFLKSSKYTLSFTLFFAYNYYTRYYIILYYIYYNKSRLLNTIKREEEEEESRYCQSARRLLDKIWEKLVVYFI